MIQTIWGLVAVLLAVGIIAIVLAVQFGKKYKTIGMRKNKLICVGCTVAACVCIITAVQILLMFRTVLWG
ncbi:MAG: hypothetical protein IJF50_09615 [Peptococcaceae bacterium]|nr:hypothetical protein [Peptococcaceae bacterium]MBQ2994084.1 hypothetical protein [Peptococcaceae bacterium]